MANFSQKKFYYKVFNSQGVYITTWSQDVSNDPSFKSIINGGLSELEINLSRLFNSINENDSNRDINFRNEVQLWIKDKESGNGVLIYDGFISGYSPYLDGNEEYIKVTCVGYVSDLEASDFIDANGNTAIQYPELDYTDPLNPVPIPGTNDPGFIIEDILNKANTKVKAGDISLTGQSINYVYNNTTARQAIDKAKEYSLSDWFWYVGPDNLLNFKEANVSNPDHILTIGKDILKLDTQKTMNDLKNEVRFIGGFYDTNPALKPTDVTWTPNTQLYKIYRDSASIAQYGLRSHVIIDKNVITETTADAQAQKFLDENSQPVVRATIEVLDSNGDDFGGYDIESLKPGDTVKIIDPKYSALDIGNQPYSLTQIFIIQTVQYDFDKATIELSQRPPWSVITLQKQINQFTQSNNSSIPTYPSAIVTDKTPSYPTGTGAPTTNVINNQVIGAQNQPGLYVIYDQRHSALVGYMGKDPASTGIYGFILERGYGLMCRINAPGMSADYGRVYVDSSTDACWDAALRTPSFIIDLPGNYNIGTEKNQALIPANKLKFQDGITGGSILRMYGNTAKEVRADKIVIFSLGAVDCFKPFRLYPYFTFANGPEADANHSYDQEGFMYLAAPYTGSTNAVRIYINGAWKTLIS